MSLNLKTSPELLEALKKAVSIKMTPAQRREQRISLVYGQLGGTMTKERIREILA